MFLGGSEGNQWHEMDSYGSRITKFSKKLPLSQWLIRKNDNGNVSICNNNNSNFIKGRVFIFFAIRCGIEVHINMAKYSSFSKFHNSNL